MQSWRYLYAPPVSTNGKGEAVNAAPKTLAVTEIKAFVPARDFELSKRFYLDMGLTMAFSNDEIAYFHCGHCSSLLQFFYVPALADIFMMNLLTPDVDTWWAHVETADIANKSRSRNAYRASTPGDARFHDN